MELKFPNGRSVVIKYRSVSEVYEHCLKLAASMNLRCEVTQFEVTGVNVDVMNDQSVARQTTVAHTRVSDAEIVLYTNHAQYPSHPLNPETCTNAVFGTKDCSVLYESADNPPHLQISSSTAGSVMAGVSNKGKSTSSHRSVSRTRDKGRGQQKQHTQDEPRQTRAKTKAMTTNGADEFMSKQRKNLMCRKRYNEDEDYRQSKKLDAVKKYKYNEAHRERVKSQHIVRYQQDGKHRAAMIEQSKNKYAQNHKHRAAMKARSVLAYKESEVHRENLKRQIAAVRLEKEKEKGEMHRVIPAFKEMITHGLDYICSVCNRLFFENQVVCCRKESYTQKGLAVKTFAEKCITEKHVQCPQMLKELWLSMYVSK